MGNQFLQSGNSIRHNYLSVLERISSAARMTGRDPGRIRLVVVTKGQSLEKIQAVIAAGALDLGENYVEEAIPKIDALSDTPGLMWHMVGHVQSRKAQQVCENFSYVHSLDSLKLAFRLNRFAGDLHMKLPVLLECNMSGEETKFGFPAWDGNRWEQLLAELNQIVKQPSLVIHGLMCMAPYAVDPESSRSFFQRLFRLQEFLREQLPEGEWSELSMGMSADFEIAVQEGATIIRVGEAILGKRN